MKNFICMFVLIVMVAFSGCASIGGAGGSSSSGDANGGKLSEADFQKMGITHGGYGNSN